VATISHQNKTTVHFPRGGGEPGISTVRQKKKGGGGEKQKKKKNPKGGVAVNRIPAGTGLADWGGGDKGGGGDGGGGCNYRERGRGGVAHALGASVNKVYVSGGSELLWVM